MDSAEFLLGTVTAVSQENGLRIRLDGQDAAMSKYYKMLNTGADAPGTGDRVVVMKHSGTYVVMGKIGTPNQNSGKVDRSGDTMTGDLKIHDAAHYMDSDELTIGTRPDSNKWSKRIAFRDSAKKAFARVQGYQGSNGNVGIQLIGEQTVNGENKTNYLGLYMSDDGNSVVDISSAAWRKALGLGTNGAFPITVAQGGTGATSAAGHAVFAGPNSSTAAAPSFRALVADDIPSLNASKITAGTLPIARGGSGDTQTVWETTISNVATAGANVTLTQALFCRWGKLAMIEIMGKATANIAAGSTVFTLVSGKRPALDSSAQVWRSTTFVPTIQQDGTAVLAGGTLSSGSGFTILACYLLP